MPWPACHVFGVPARSFTFRLRNAFYGGFDGALSAAEATVLLRAVILQPINPLRQPINPSKAKASTTTHPSISLLLAGSKALKRPLVRKPMGHPLGLNPAGVVLFRNRALGGAAESTVLLRATAKASTPFHPHPSIHPSLFAFSWFEGAETAPGPQTNGPPLGPESCWGSAVSQPCPKRCFCSRIQGAAQGHGQSFHPIPYPSIHPSLFAFSYPRCCYGPRPKLPPHSTPIHPSIHLSLFAFSWFEGAETALGPQTNWPPLGRESCWGSAVSQPCPRRCFCSRIHGVVLLRAAAKASTFHPIPLPSIHPSIHLFAFIAGSKVLKRPLVRKPMGHPLGLNPAGVLLFRNRALGGAAESTVLLRATAKASTPFHPHPSIHPSLFAFSWFEGAETAPGPQTNGPPLGPESCWGSAVSQPCPRRCFCSRIQGAAQGHGQSFHPIPYPSIHPSISLCF